MEQLTIGFAICGSFCTFSRVLPQLELLCKGYRVVPILSQVSFETDSRFGPGRAFSPASRPPAAAPSSIPFPRRSRSARSAFWTRW